MKIVFQLILFSLILLIFTKYIKIYEVPTPSMSPFIKTGSIIISISKTDNSNYDENDVVIYKIPQNKTLVTHRIIKTINLHGKIFFVTKGDNNNLEDPFPISRDDILGKVVFTVPYIGQLIRTISSYKLLCITFYAPAGLLFGRIVRKYLRRDK